MKKYGIYLITFVTSILCTTSCSDDKDNHRERWMIDNISAYNSIKTNPEYKELKSLGNEGSIYYKVLKEGEGTDSIYYSSAVLCYYKGWLIADYPEFNLKNGHVFDRALFDDGAPASFYVNGVVAGWKTALQHMVKGDKWEIWVPYQLGYGKGDQVNDYTGAVTIPGYSTLVFELEIVDSIGAEGM